MSRRAVGAEAPFTTMCEHLDVLSLQRQTGKVSPLFRKGAIQRQGDTLHSLPGEIFASVLMADMSVSQVEEKLCGTLHKLQIDPARIHFLYTN